MSRRPVLAVCCNALALTVLVQGSFSALPQRVAADAHGSVEEARRAYLAADFSGAVRMLESALRDRALTPVDAAEAHRYLSALEAMLGHRELARAHADAAVALAPDVAAPDGAPEEVGRMLADARAHFGPTGTRLRLELSRSGRGARATATLSPAPPSVLVARIEIACAANGGTPARASARAADGEARVSLEAMPEGAEIACDATARTEAGAALFTAHAEQRPSSVSPREAAAAADSHAIGRSDGALTGARADDESGGSAWPWIAAGAGVVVAAAVVVLVVVVTSSSDAHVAASIQGW